MPAQARKRASSRSRLAVDERRNQLLELGLRLFADVPYDELSIDAIAHAAGVSKGLLYHYFPGKREYYIETVRLAAERLLADAELTAAGPPSPELLARALDTYLDFALRHAGAYTTLMRGGGLGADPEVAAIIGATRGALIDRLRLRLGIEGDDPHLRVFLRGWIGLVELTSLEWLDRPSLDRHQLRDLWVRLFVAGLVAAAPPSAP